MVTAFAEREPGSSFKLAEPLTSKVEMRQLQASRANLGDMFEAEKVIRK